MKMEYQARQLFVCLELLKKVSVVFRLVKYPFDTLYLRRQEIRFLPGLLNRYYTRLLACSVTLANNKPRLALKLEHAGRE